jgi:indolepyruvate ferredoxin oxidoreductase
MIRFAPAPATVLDIFARKPRLIADYETIVPELSASRNPGNHALAIEIASQPEKMRGFGHIKARNVESVKACETELLVLPRSKDTQASAA